MAMTIVEAAPGITGGVDTHLDTHVAAALDPLGRLIGSEPFSADAAGYKALLAWLETFGEVTKVGIEGTGSYGVGLSRYLRRKGIDVVEVNRPNRQARRNHGKSDPLDAIEDARAALSGRASGAGKTNDGPVEAIRVLVVAKRSARRARIKAIVQMRHLGISAPEQLHCRLKNLSVTALVAEGAKLRSTRSSDPVTAATKAALSSLAHRVQVLDAEIAELATRSSHSWPPPHPIFSDSSALVPTPRRPYSWPPATTRSAFIQKPPGPTCAACHPFRPTRGRTRDISDFTAVATARRTALCGALSWSALPMTQKHGSTSSAG
jgi:hypothetical protein